jgi:hypothetical protein
MAAAASPFRDRDYISEMSSNVFGNGGGRIPEPVSVNPNKFISGTIQGERGVWSQNAPSKKLHTIIEDYVQSDPEQD